MDVRLGARACWVLIVVFLALISAPGVLRELSSDPVRGTMADVFQKGGTPVVDRLRAVEKKVDDGAWLRPIRAWTQTALLRTFREGNRKVLVGRDGWLFHRPGVQALTGRGPMLGPTFSVSKDPSLKHWTGPLPVIKEFASQLQSRGIRLVLVPVPDKAGLWADKLSGVAPTMPGSRRHHPDWPEFLQALRDEVTVIDLIPPLPYLATDTHWEADGAHAAAATVAAALQGRPVPTPAPAETPHISDIGDLVASLGLPPGMAEAWRVTAPAPSAPPTASDPAAPVVLLGDSNVAMYEDAGLPFHRPGAGFGSWLATALGESVHIIAVNGGGATQVRQRFAALPDDVVRAKRTVIWVLAERDLFMDPAVARANGVEWKPVAFNPRTSNPDAATPSTEPLVIEATLRAKSTVLDMASVDYPDALFVAEFDVDRVVRGSYDKRELAAVLWNFRKRVLQPTATLKPGQKVRLTLVPWLDQHDLLDTNFSDDFQRFDLTLMFALTTEVINP